MRGSGSGWVGRHQVRSRATEGAYSSQLNGQERLGARHPLADKSFVRAGRCRLALPSSSFAAVLWLFLLLVTAGVAPAAAHGPESWTEVREIYLEAVAEEPAIHQGLNLIDRLRAAEDFAAGSEEDVVLSAYEGALITLRAKHGFWPPSRLGHMRAGLEILDEAVGVHPGHAEIRFLRLLSCYYLPGIFGRGWSVQEDLNALKQLLPGSRDRFPRDLYDDMVRFVLDNGDATAEERTTLQSLVSDRADE